MISPVNHNASYLFEIDGLTVWERLRSVRNFLSDRRKALKISEYGVKKYERDIAKLGNSDEDQDTKFEMELNKEDTYQAVDVCRREVEFLEQFEKELMELADQQRIPGKTDDEMYELNYYNEIVARNVRKVHAEIVTLGSIVPSTMEQLLRCPPALKLVCEQNILNYDNIKQLAFGETTNKYLNLFDSQKSNTSPKLTYNIESDKENEKDIE
jgi:hypothetical protein